MSNIRIWIEDNTSIENESTWDLYKRFDPKGKRAMNQAHFYSLLPKEWKKSYEYINATYEDCLALEKWFEDNNPINDESTWDLYKRFDPKGKRAMNQANFYSLLPKKWKKCYEYINATYEDCLATENKYGKVTSKLIENYRNSLN